MKANDLSSIQQPTFMSDLYEAKEHIAEEFHFDPMTQVQARMQGQRVKQKIIQPPIQGKGHHLPVNPNSKVPPYKPDKTMQEVWKAKESVSKSKQRENVA